MNLTAKERNLIKGALRRVFSRSEIRREALNAAVVRHSDPSRPRVTKWALCADCKLPEAAYKMHCDHIDPVVPVNKTLEMMTWDELVERLFCHINNLQILCLACHTRKSKGEAKERAIARKGRKNVKGT